jgi:hypothetical protein
LIRTSPTSATFALLMASLTTTPAPLLSVPYSSNCLIAFSSRSFRTRSALAVCSSSVSFFFAILASC